MYRGVKMHKYYAIEVDIRDEEEQDNIEQFVNEGDVVLLCDLLEDLEVLGIDLDEVEVVHRG